MGSYKHRLYSTETDNLISNLRGEVGEIIFTWVLLRNLMAQASILRSGDPSKDMENRQLLVLNALVDKLEDEVAARLSELAQFKIGRLNFFFAYQKLGQPEGDVQEFAKFVEKSRIKEKRDRYVSHKDLPEKWEEHRYLMIPYPVLLRGIAHMLGLMKKVDSLFLGPRAKYLWREMRKKRYDPLYPARASYLLLPYLRLSPEDRLQILKEEAAQGDDIWEELKTTIDGEPATIVASKEWGVLNFGSRLLVLHDYPLIELKSISFGSTDTYNVDAEFDDASNGDA